MKVTWLTQAGLLFENDKIKILVDPYLSDSIGEVEPKKKRRMPIDESFLDLKPDVILITHDHRDHLDTATLDHYLKGEGSVTVMAGECAYKKLLEYGGDHNYVLLAPHSVWSQQGVTFYSVHAEHSDRTAVGFIIDDGKETFYVSGDTLYNYDVIDDVLDLAPDGVDFAFLPINGVGNNMNMTDAARFAHAIGANYAVPLHWGLFDGLNGADFPFESKIVPEFFCEIKLP